MPFEPMIEALRHRFIEKKDSLPQRFEPDELQLYFLGPVDDDAENLFSKYDVSFQNVPSGKLRRYFSFKNVIDIVFVIPVGVVLAIIKMWKIMPDLVISKGGYGSVPIAIAAVIFHIPILLHESDVVPGKTNEYLARIAAAITVGFAEAKVSLKKWKYKVFVTGTPVRGQLSLASKPDAKRALGIPENEKVLLVMGGSQGARQINETLLKILPVLIVDVAIVHITGKDNFDAVSTVGKELLAHSPRADMYKVYPKLSEKMRHALNAADVIITRAGASSLSEIARLRTPSLIIPLASSANDHQRRNALVFERAGAALVLDPTNVNKGLLKQNILRLLTDEKLRSTISDNLSHVDYAHASRDIAELAIKVASGFAPEKKKSPAN